ncbi:MAG: hypothetical protein HQM16_01230 [Deltaproteobacteria bacterium]|nr:hypothetical protein [Deltaproteobacteria bacterium]
MDTSDTSVDEIGTTQSSKATDAQGEGITPPDNNYFEDPGSLPTGSIINPSLDSGNFLTFAPDAQGNVPITATAGAVTDFEAGDQIAVSVEEIIPDVACKERPSVIARSKATRQSPWSGWLIKEAHAQEVATTCSDEFTYCPIDTDGSFKCFVNQGVSTEKLYYTIVDKDCAPATDQVVEDTPKKNLLYVGNTPTDVNSAGDELYSLANGNGVVARDDGSGMRVAGDYNLGYKTFDAEGTELAYADSDALLGVMGTEGVQLLNYEAGIVLDSGEKVTDPNAKAYTFLRAMNGILYYGIEQESAAEGYLNFAVTEEKWKREKHQIIWITRAGDTDTQGNEIRHTRTLGFGDADVGGWKWTLVVFNDENNIRIKAIKEFGRTDEDRLGGEIWKDNNQVQLIDMIAYYDDDSKIVDFALLDKNNKVWLGNFNLETGIKTIDEANVVMVGKDPQAMTFSRTSGKLYVLNHDDQTVSVISLMEENGLPIAKPVVGTVIKLADSVPNKTVSFSANSLLLKDKQLIVTDVTNKSLLLIDVGEYE